MTIMLLGKNMTIIVLTGALNSKPNQKLSLQMVVVIFVRKDMSL